VDFIGSGYGTVASCCEHGDELSVSMIRLCLVDYVSYCKLFKDYATLYSVIWSGDSSGYGLNDRRIGVRFPREFAVLGVVPRLIKEASVSS
jgi:hypothetical protein